MQDFGGPVGFRLAAHRPERVTALIIQDANAYREGMTPEVHDWLSNLAKDHSADAQAKASPTFELPYTKRHDRYEEWHAYFRRYQPPTLIVWGRGDFVFGVPGAEACKRDLPRAELHILEGAAQFAPIAALPE